MLGSLSVTEGSICLPLGEVKVRLSSFSDQSDQSMFMLCAGSGQHREKKTPETSVINTPCVFSSPGYILSRMTWNCSSAVLGVFPGVTVGDGDGVGEADCSATQPPNRIDAINTMEMNSFSFTDFFKRFSQRIGFCFE